MVNEIEKKISQITELKIFEQENKIFEKLSNQEQQESKINGKDLLSLYQKDEKRLIQFTCLTISLRNKVKDSENIEVLEEVGLSKGFSILFAIYYWFLNKDLPNELEIFLEKRKIPNSNDFQNFLQDNFWKSKGLVLSNSYIQYGSGFEKEDVKIEDIKNGIEYLKSTDDEHGVFWVSILDKNQNEFIIEAFKNISVNILQNEKQTSLSLNSWEDMENIFDLLLDRNFNEILSKK